MPDVSQPDPTKPLIVHADRTLMLETFNDLAEPARAAIAPFVELEKSPEYLHTYRISPLSLWNATSAGFTAEQMLRALQSFAKFPLPQNVVTDIKELSGRWGRLRLLGEEGRLVLRVDPADASLLLELGSHDHVRPLLGERLGEHVTQVPLANRGSLKQALLALGWPVQDLAGYQAGEALDISLAKHLDVRPYQEAAAQAFYRAGSSEGGSGVVVLPPGSGKTVVGMAAMSLVGQRTLVLTTNRTSTGQWQRELLAKTSLQPEQVVEYGSRTKGIGAVTLCTYQMLTTRKRGAEPGAQGEYPHMQLFRDHQWGLVIYDEVHMLPAPVFRLTAELQALRRLGLTATLIREDGREGDVFSLIGPKRYDGAWRELERDGWIASVHCTEVRLALDDAGRRDYALTDPRLRFRLAAENPRKLSLMRRIRQLHAGEPTLIIGVYLSQLKQIAAALDVPLVTGETPQERRDALFDDFRAGRIRTLVLSKVGNFALDLPDASVMIQVSGTFGSRQEEAQRMGRLLRPKAPGQGAQFYSLVTRETDEETFAHNRQRFLTEQGYTYRIMSEDEWLDPQPPRLELLN